MFFNMTTTEIWPLIAAEAAERKKATQFEKGKSPNPGGKPQVNAKTCSPEKRDAKVMHKQSTVGQIAAKANVSGTEPPNFRPTKLVSPCPLQCFQWDLTTLFAPSASANYNRFMPRKYKPKKPKPTPIGPFFCVIRISDYRTLYVGTDPAAAETASGDPTTTVCATADSPGAAERAAAMLAGAAQPRSPRSRSV